MSFLTFCFQIKITPRRRRQRCRLILSKRQIKGRGFQKCNQNFLAHWCVFKLPAKGPFETFRTKEVTFLYFLRPESFEVLFWRTIQIHTSVAKTNLDYIFEILALLSVFSIKEACTVDVTFWA